MRSCVIAFILMAPIQSFAESYAIRAEYSNQFGFPVEENADSMITSIGSGLDISSREECLAALQSDMVERISTGYAMEYGASNVVLKCKEYWESEDCPATYPGCISSADFGHPKHIQTYYDGAIISSHLRFSPEAHEVIQTLSYGADSDHDGNLDIVFVVQKMLNRNCQTMIESSDFRRVFKEQYFRDERTKAYKINCFRVNSAGKATGIASEIIRR